MKYLKYCNLLLQIPSASTLAVSSLPRHFHSSGTHTASFSSAAGVLSPASIVSDVDQPLFLLGRVNNVRSGASERENIEKHIPPGTEMPRSSRDKPEGSQPVSLGLLQTIGEAIQSEELEEETEAVDPKSDEARQQGNEAQLEKRELALLLQCYSSTATDPSEGSWKKVDGGVAMSPVNSDYLDKR